MIERFTKKRNAIVKRITTVILSLMVAVTAVIPCIPATSVYASEWIAVGAGTLAGGALAGAGKAIGEGLMSKAIDYFSDPSETKTENNVNTYIYRGGNTSTSNVTNNYRVFKDYTTTNNNTTNYRYDFYNPVTKTYNTVNNFKYNQTNKTYNYTTYNTTNNYEYNYYITDNSTHITYYVVEEDKSTGAIFETYYEIYFQLPDGRNSYNLTKEDIWGTTFIYDYSKYESVKEDDGTTLGLWHLDGDTKDSSYYGNTAGSSYTSEFKDAKFEGGKYFSNNLNDFLELKLDKVTLPNSYTLEWVQYISDNDFKQFDLEESPLPIPMSSNVEWKYGYIVSSSIRHDSSNSHRNCDADAYRYLNSKFSTNSGIYIKSNNNVYDIPRETFISCALVYNNGVYSLYRNGIKVLETS